ncbi:MAG: DNA-binding protein [Cyanothece sp. SIO1E1]|nr:DNA-binding protein [Cyanothece sp. SIO1E1]
MAKAKKQRSPVWVSTSKAAAELGCSTDFLLDNREKLFQRGKHWRNLNPQAWRPTYRWHLKHCEQLMQHGN